MRFDGMLAHFRYVMPIYGYGWVSGVDSTARDVPEPFRFGCDRADAGSGNVIGQHEFTGATACLSRRHAAEDGIFNVEIRRNGELVAVGFAKA